MLLLISYLFVCFLYVLVRLLFWFWEKGGAVRGLVRGVALGDERVVAGDFSGVIHDLLTIRVGFEKIIASAGDKMTRKHLAASVARAKKIFWNLRQVSLEPKKIPAPLRQVSHEPKNIFGTCDNWAKAFRKKRGACDKSRKEALSVFPRHCME